MPAPITTSPPPARDDLDDLFNYDVDTDDVFRDYHPAMDAPAQTTSPSRPKATDLGIDEEIQVAKKRKPIAIPSRDPEAAAHHEGEAQVQGQGARGSGLLSYYRHYMKLTVGSKYADVARLLNLYQLWLDDLYPRAKFADGLAMIEKLGHTKRLQTMRREWMKEGRPLERREDEMSSRETPSHPTANATKPAQNSANAHKTSSATSPTHPQPTTRPPTSTSRPSNQESLFISDDDEPDPHPPDDELDTLLAEDALLTTSTAPHIPEPHDVDPYPNPPSDDELDALLAEGTPHPPSFPPAPKTAPHDEFADEMEAMAGMDDVW
ncbi:chromosome segregation in meiosis- protein [Xylographa vitiligo]|nr:chromosome segregation in meiosis- protein [Xylographa vitiligo]